MTRAAPARLAAAIGRAEISLWRRGENISGGARGGHRNNVLPNRRA